MCVHGLSGSSRWWHATEDALRGRHELHLVELPGFGGERRARFTLDSATRELVVALERVGRAHLVGHSLGGLLAARVAARRPELVDRLVLVAPAGALPRRRISTHALSAALALRGARPQFVRILAHDALRAGPRTLWQAANELLAEDVRPDLARIRAPTLLVWGEGDRLVPAGLGEAFAAAIPDARLELIRGARHVPMIERPAEFAALVDDFLA